VRRPRRFKLGYQAQQTWVTRLQVSATLERAAATWEDKGYECVRRSSVDGLGFGPSLPGLDGPGAFPQGLLLLRNLFFFDPMTVLVEQATIQTHTRTFSRSSKKGVYSADEVFCGAVSNGVELPISKRRMGGRWPVICTEAKKQRSDPQSTGNINCSPSATTAFGMSRDEVKRYINPGGLSSAERIS